MRQTKDTDTQARQAVKITSEMNASLGMPLRWFLPLAAIAAVLVFIVEPGPGMTSGFAVTMALGGILMLIGNAIPGLNRIGGGVIFAILIPAVLIYGNLMPTPTAEAIGNFYSLSEFGEFVVAALITGSILGMNRTLLLRAGSRIIVPILGTIAICFILFGVIGEITGYGMGKMLFYVVGPVLAGGIAAGAIPISEVIAQNSGGEAGHYLTMLVPAIVVANLVCIVVAGSLNMLGKKRPTLFRHFNGNGELATGNLQLGENPQEELAAPGDTVKATIIGLFVAGTLFVISNFISSFVPSIHAYVFLIIICAIIKIFIPLPDFIVSGTDLWYRLVANAFIPAVLVAVSVVAIDIGEVLNLLADPIYMIATVSVVIVAALAAGFVGWLVRLHFIESAISGGLGLADIGSSGDLAVLGAANRLSLLPFLSISSRIGGGLVVLSLSLIAPLVL